MCPSIGTSYTRQLDNPKRSPRVFTLLQGVWRSCLHVLNTQKHGCAIAPLAPRIHDEIKSIPGVFRFRLHKSKVPFQTTLGVTDRCCITFCISESKLDSVSGSLESIYQYLKTEVTGLGKQELQRMIPLFWSGSKCTMPAFFQHQYVAFLDVRHCIKKPHNKLQNKIQEILISMDIPYHFQKRSILVLYASGILLETFRQAIFHENIILSFGREEGCFQCNFVPSSLQDSWQVELQTIGSTRYEAYQIEDDGTLMSRDGSVIPELSAHLSHKFDASQVCSSIVHAQGKGQQKVVAFLANSDIQSQIPSNFKHHQDSLISQAKGINQGAISAFFPMPHNDLSRKRFSRVKSYNFCKVNVMSYALYLMRLSLFAWSIIRSLATHRSSFSQAAYSRSPLGLPGLSDQQT